MAKLQQIDCFKIHFIFFRILGMSPKLINGQPVKYYKFYSIIMFGFFTGMYMVLLSLELFYMLHSDSYVDLLMLYFNEICVLCKVITFSVWHDKIWKLIKTLESDIFQPKTAAGLDIINDAKNFTRFFWKCFAGTCIISCFIRIYTGFFIHLILSVPLELPVSDFNFISDAAKDKWIYPLYFYQAVGMTGHMFCNVNVDTFLIGVMTLANAQLDVLRFNLATINKRDDEDDDALIKNTAERDTECIADLNQCIAHYEEVGKFCADFQDVFSTILFAQFSMGSSVICVCLFRFLFPAKTEYYLFLMTYMSIMLLQILGPCWFGTQMMAKSADVSGAVYSCAWPRCSERFKRSMRVLAERARRPLSVTVGHMFLLSLDTFGSILHTAYSFFALLRNMTFRHAQH